MKKCLRSLTLHHFVVVALVVVNGGIGDSQKERKRERDTSQWLIAQGNKNDNGNENHHSGGRLLPIITVLVKYQPLICICIQQHVCRPRYALVFLTKDSCCLWRLPLSIAKLSMADCLLCCPPGFGNPGQRFKEGMPLLPLPKLKPGLAEN